MAHFWPATSLAQKKILEPWCAKIAEASKQQMTCQIYPAMQLGGTPPQLIDQAADGIADIVWTLPGYSAGRFPSMEVMELPFMTRTAESGSRVAWQIYDEFGRKDFTDVKPLAFNVHDRGQIHNNVRPITRLADFKGLKMRAPTRLTNKMLSAFGATPVNIPLPGLADSVSKGVADGYILPWEVIPTMKLHDMTRYHSEINAPENALFSALFTIAMNKQRYDGLPDHLKKVIDDNSGADFSAAIGKAWDESVNTAKQPAVERGNAINAIDHAGINEIKAAAAQVEADWMNEMGQKGYDGKAMVARAKALIAQAAQP
ncbi:TRAP transporter substrate-binding protein [Neisseria leonii]|uniref:TRAP transporter substrate-binding protein n=1 Tax=Neisseria leonii TaxID=2995413 RepID=UPI00237BCF4B|nr:TRAP transporter substrate-binding protein [Neisseria sp. 3986]MDD9326302.1 TRAP transporter substrate-binding protein [Neisseria sp. 3986]